MSNTGRSRKRRRQEDSGDEHQDIEIRAPPPPTLTGIDYGVVPGTDDSTSRRTRLQIQERDNHRRQAQEALVKLSIPREELALTVNTKKSFESTLTPTARIFGPGENVVAAFCSRVKGLATKEEKIRVIGVKVDDWAAHAEKVDAIADILERLAKDCGIDDLEMEAATTDWSHVKQRAVDSRNAADRKMKGQDVVYGIFDKATIAADFQSIIDAGSTTWKNFASAARECKKSGVKYNEFMRYILRAQIERMSSHHSRKDEAPQSVDFLRVRSAIQQGDSVPEMKDLMAQLSSKGMFLGRNRLYTASAENAITSIDVEADVEEVVAEEGLPRAPDLTRGPGSENGSPVNVDQVDALGEQIDIESRRYGRDISPTYDSGDELEGAGGDLYDPDNDEDATTEESGGDDSDDDLNPDAPKAKRGKKAIRGKIGKRPCSCDTVISASFLQHCKQQNNKLTDAAQVALIKMWRTNRKKGEICFAHTAWLAAHLGFRVKGHNTSGLEDLLERYHDHVLHGTLGDFKTNNDTYQLFRRLSRPPHPDDGLGPYKFRHAPLPDVVFSEEQQKQLRTELGIDSEAWERDGSLIQDGMLWWKIIKVNLAGAQRSIFDVVEEEFEMYHYHLRRINDKSNLGWCRTMFFGVVQQAMRQDPWYYLMYCALRGDRCTWLISYPYYTKYASRDDTTFFRHIDLNVPRLIANKRGYFQIQGTLSMDDEDESDCTEILPGMHNHLEEWYDLLIKRQPKLNSYVHRIDSKMFTHDDAEKFQTNWTPTPCKSLQVRITDPAIPHGAKGPSVRKRRTMLPWYVGVQKDHRALEVVESGTWDELSQAHRDLVSGPATPSGLANRYGDIPYAFPAAVQLTGLGPISDALVGRIRHDNATVVSLKQRLLTGGSAFRDTYLNSWRHKAVRAVVDAFEECRAAEKTCFGENSYFYRTEKGLALDTTADIDPHPTFARGGHGGGPDDDSDDSSPGKEGSTTGGGQEASEISDLTEIEDDNLAAMELDIEGES